MYLAIIDPQYPPGFQYKVTVASQKRCSVEITKVEEYIFISVYANNRPVGRFSFEKEENEYVLHTRFVIEQEFYPQEFALYSLRNFLQNTKTTYLLWN